MSDRVFYSLITSFVFGVAFWSFFNLGLSFLALFFLISIVVALIDRKFVLISISLVLFSLGALRMDFAQDRNFILNNSLGKKAEITGIIIEEPSKRENSIQLIIKPENSDEKVLITTERADIFNYGDLISAQGVLKTPKNFITDNNREFDYINYLSKDEIFYSMLFPKIEVLDTGRGNFIKEKLFS